MALLRKLIVLVNCKEVHRKAAGGEGRRRAGEEKNTVRGKSAGRLDCGRKGGRSEVGLEEREQGGEEGCRRSRTAGGGGRPEWEVVCGRRAAGGGLREEGCGRRAPGVVISA